MTGPVPPKRRSRQIQPRRRADPPGDIKSPLFDGGLSGPRIRWATWQQVQDEFIRLARKYGGSHEP